VKAEKAIIEDEEMVCEPEDLKHGAADGFDG
jgi:hypothetical protein